jgi:hypothetical protein
MHVDGIVSSGRRLRASLLGGACLALGWAALSVILGSSAAHADDGSGLLDGAAGLLSDTGSSAVSVVDSTLRAATGIDPAAPTAEPDAAPVATNLVGSAASAIAETAQPVADVVPPDPAASPSEGVADTVGIVAHDVPDALASVSTGLGSGELAAVTTPVVDVVTALPVVGDVIAPLGVGSAIGGLVGTIDDLTGSLAPIVGIDPGTGPTHSPAASPPSSGPVAVAADPSVAGSAPPGAASRWQSGRGSSIMALPRAALLSTADSPPGSPKGPDPVLPAPWAAPVGTGSSPSAGAAAGAPAWFAACPASFVFPSPADAPTGAADDDALPPSPVFPTDVSPD